MLTRIKRSMYSNYMSHHLLLGESKNRAAPSSQTPNPIPIQTHSWLTYKSTPQNVGVQKQSLNHHWPAAAQIFSWVVRERYVPTTSTHRTPAVQDEKMVCCTARWLASASQHELLEGFSKASRRLPHMHERLSISAALLLRDEQSYIPTFEFWCRSTWYVRGKWRR